MDQGAHVQSSPSRFIHVAAYLGIAVAVAAGYELLRIRPLASQLSKARGEIEYLKAAAADLEERNRNQERLLGEVAALGKHEVHE